MGSIKLKGKEGSVKQNKAVLQKEAEQPAQAPQIQYIEKIVEIIKEVPVEVVKIVKEPVEIIKLVDRVVEKPIEVTKYVTKVIEKPVEIIKQIEVPVEVRVPVITKELKTPVWAKILAAIVALEILIGASLLFT